MSYRTLQTLVVIAAGLFGLGFLLVPEATTSPYAVTDWNEGTLAVARLYGVALLMVAGASWACLPVGELNVQRRIALCSAVISAIGALVAAQSALAGSANALMWSTVAIYGFFCVAWAVFWVRTGHAEPAQSPTGA